MRSAAQKKKKTPTSVVRKSDFTLAGGPPIFSWCQRGSDTHSVTQIYLTFFAAMAQMRDPLPSSIRVVPDTIIFAANRPTTWFAFDSAKRKISPHAAAQTTASNIVLYFTEVMRSRELLDLSRGFATDEFGRPQDPSSSATIAAPRCSGTARFPCAVWMYDCFDVDAAEKLADEDRHVCVEYLDLAGVTALVDQLVSGVRPPHGVLQEYVATETPSLSGTSEEYLCTISAAGGGMESNSNAVGNASSFSSSSSAVTPSATSLSSMLELSSVVRCRNLHVPRSDNLQSVPTFAGGAPLSGINSSTLISTAGFCAIPPVAVLARTTAPLNSDFLMTAIREKQEVFDQIRNGAPGWSVTVASEPLLSTPMAIHDCVTTGAQVIAALVTERDRFSDAVVSPQTRVVLWLKPIREGGGYALLGAVSAFIPCVRLSYQMIDTEAIVRYRSLASANNAASASLSALADKENRKKQQSSPTRRSSPPTTRRSPPKPHVSNNNNATPLQQQQQRIVPAPPTSSASALRNFRSSTPVVTSPSRQRQEQQQQEERPNAHLFQVESTRRPHSALPSRGVTMSSSAVPITATASASAASTVGNGVRRQDLAVLQRHPATVQQNVDRIFERSQPRQFNEPNYSNNGGGSGLDHHAQLPPRPVSAQQRAAQQFSRPVSAQTQSARVENYNHSATPANVATARTPTPDFYFQQPQLQQQQQHRPSLQQPPTRGTTPNALHHHQHHHEQQQHHQHHHEHQQAPRIQYVHFPQVTEREIVGQRAAEVVQTRPISTLDVPEEIMCTNCGAWNPRDNCRQLSYHAVAVSVKHHQKANERKLKHIFPRKSKFSAQRAVSSLDDVRNAHAGDVLFSDEFEWAPIPPILESLSVDLDDILCRGDVWRQRHVLLCESCASSFHVTPEIHAQVMNALHNSGALLLSSSSGAFASSSFSSSGVGAAAATAISANGLSELLHPRSIVAANAVRRVEPLMQEVRGKEVLDYSIRACSPEQSGANRIAMVDRPTSASGRQHQQQQQQNQAASSSLLSQMQRGVPPFNAAHSQIAARNALHEQPPPAACFSNVTDAVVTTDLQMQHRQIRQARRDKYAMRLVATECHRGIDVFSANLVKRREVEEMLSSFVLPVQISRNICSGHNSTSGAGGGGGGFSAQIDDPLSLILSRELFDAMSKKCREPAELALGVVMPRPAKGKGPWRIPKPIGVSSHSILCTEENDFDMPLAIGENRRKNRLRRTHRRDRRRLLFGNSGGDSTNDEDDDDDQYGDDEDDAFDDFAIGGRTDSDNLFWHERQPQAEKAAERNSSRKLTYRALQCGNQTFSEMTEAERAAIVEFLGDETSALDNEPE